MQHWGDPDAVYGLPEEQRTKAIAEAMMRHGTPDTERPLTIKRLHNWVLDTGLLKAKNG